MSLADFMKQLQDQDANGIVYSEVPEQPVRVIPPDQTAVRIIAPDPLAANKPTKIKLNLNPVQKPVSQPVQQPIQSVVQPQPQPQVQQVQQLPVQEVVYTPPVKQEVPVQQPVYKQPEPPPVSTTELTDEELFIRSGTEDSKRTIWMDYFAQAKASRKHNPVVDRMRVGRFTITPDNKVLILPDYDVVGKDPDDILKDSWF